METIERSIEVDVPVTTAYNQWTQFEEFPYFMEGVKEVRQLDNTRVHWVVEVGGRTKEWDAEIVEQRPEQKLAERGGEKSVALVMPCRKGAGQAHLATW